MDLFTYYNLSESANVDNILEKLENLSSELKIDYSYHESKEVFRIIDIDLTEKEVSTLQKFFEDNDVLPDFDCEDMSDYDDLYGFEGDDDGYDF
jgi:hypothetical protein